MEILKSEVPIAAAAAAAVVVLDEKSTTEISLGNDSDHKPLPPPPPPPPPPKVKSQVTPPQLQVEIKVPLPAMAMPDLSPRPSLIMYLAALSSLIGGIAMGTVSAWSSVALPDLAQADSSPQITDMETRSLISSFAQLGGTLGCFLGGPLSDGLGRKTLIVSGIPLWVLGWVAIFAANGPALIMIGRFLGGVACGFICSGLPMYLTEISTPAIRGLLGSSFETTITIGMFYVTTVGVNTTWRWLCAFCLVPVGLMAATMPFMPESPIWLSGRGRKADAHQALARLRGATSDLTSELVAADNSFFRNEQVKTLAGSGHGGGGSGSESPLKKLYAWLRDQIHLWRRPEAWRPLYYGVVLAFFQQFSGLAGLLFFQKDILLAANMPHDENAATVAIFSSQMVCTIVAGFLVDRLGRVPLLIFSGITQSTALTVLGFYFWSPAWFTANGLSATPVACCVLFFVGYSFGQGPVTWCLVGELSPNFIRGRVASLTAAANWMLSFVGSHSFSAQVAGMTIFGTFWLQAATALASALFAYAVLPETKGKTLEEIELMYTSSSSSSSAPTKDHGKGQKC